MTQSRDMIADFEDMDMGVDPVACVLTVLRRVQGKQFGRRACHQMRRDREYLCFELGDGSILALNPQPVIKLMTHDDGSCWPWLVAVANRADWELFMKSTTSVGVGLDAFFAVVRDEDKATQRAA
jgi:hypothetical protein